MNDKELESKLKAVRVPARSEEYWESFPTHVRSHLGRRVFVEPVQRRTPPFARNGGLALAWAVLMLLLWPAFQALSGDEHALRREMAQLPNSVQALKADDRGMYFSTITGFTWHHGMYYLVAEKP